MLTKIVSPKYEMLITYFCNKNLTTLNPRDRKFSTTKSKYTFVFFVINFVTNQNRKKNDFAFLTINFVTNLNVTMRLFSHKFF